MLVGAGSAMFTRGLVADLIRVSAPVELALVDVDPDTLDIAERLSRKMVEACRTPISVTASVDRRDVLPGATVVVCTIGVGGRRAWERDVLIPRRYGVFAPVGDTVGPGGASRALRTIPAAVEIAEDVLELCPDALFFNYSNPMAPVCRAVRRATGAEVIGLCGGVEDTATYLAGCLDVDPAALAYTSVGINHLTWFVELRASGTNAVPELRELAARRSRESDNPLSWRLFELFGAFPAPLDRHVSEFFPPLLREGAYYGKTLGVDVFNFEDTVAWGDRIFAEMRDAALSVDPLPADHLGRRGGEHAQVLEIVRSIRRDEGRVFSANLPNTGQVPNLPRDAIVEAPASVAADGVRAIAQPPLPAALAGTVATRCQWVETVVEAALEPSREKFLQALVLDGSLGSLEDAVKLADELLVAQAEYLPWARGESRAAARPAGSR